MDWVVSVLCAQVIDGAVGWERLLAAVHFSFGKNSRSAALKPFVTLILRSLSFLCYLLQELNLYDFKWKYECQPQKSLTKPGKAFETGRTIHISAKVTNFLARILLRK